MCFVIIKKLVFINHLKMERIPRNDKMIAFDVTSLFTKVPLYQNVAVILRKI